MTHEPLDKPNVVALCERHREIDAKRDQLHQRLGEAETMLADRHGWFQLTRVQRRALPAAAVLYDTEDELDALDSESALLVTRLRDLPAKTLAEAVAKLQVVARVIDPADYKDAYAVMSGAIAELEVLSKPHSA